MAQRVAPKDEGEQPASDPKRREQVREAIADWIVNGGLDDQTEAFRAQHAQDIPRRTFYRWLKEARLALSGQAYVAKVEALRKTVPERAAAAVGEVLPPPINLVETVAKFADLNAVRVIHDAIRHAESVIDNLCLSADGKPRNGKMLLSAANNMVRAVDVLVRVADRYYDIQRIEQVQDAMIEEVRKCDPETAQRILRRVQTVLAAWMS